LSEAQHPRAHPGLLGEGQGGQEDAPDRSARIAASPEALLPRATLAKLSPEKREVRSVARKKAAEVRAFLGKLVPFVILLMLDNPNTLWRDACYPVVEQ
jgi:hypothetical protein